MSFILDNIFTKNAYQEYLYEHLTHNVPEIKQLLENNQIQYYHKILEDAIKQKIISPDKVSNSIHSVIQSALTHILRPYLYNCINILNTEMSEYGKFIISGGEAFNVNIKKEYRKISPDIDTKFVLYKQENDEKNYLILLKSYEKMWYIALEKVLKFLNNSYKKIYKILQVFEECPEMKLFNVKFMKPHNNPDMMEPFVKRLTIMDKNLYTKHPVFFDIYLFAVDMILYSYSALKLDIVNDNISEIPEFENKEYPTITGILDLPFMRFDEFGYDIINPENHMSVNVKITSNQEDLNLLYCFNILGKNDKFKYEGEVFFATTKFLYNEINEMIHYNIRPKKTEKDVYRQQILSNTNLFSDIEKYKKTNVNYVYEYKKTKYIPVNSVIFKNNINPIKIAKIIKYVAPPKINFINVKQKGVLKTCFDVDIETTFTNMNRGEYYNYNTNQIECCKSISNQFQFRLNPKYISIKLFNNDEKMKEQLACMLNQLLDYILEAFKIDTIEELKSYLGVMLFNYNDNISYYIDIDTIVNNILILIQNLRFTVFVKSEFNKKYVKIYEKISLRIIENLFKLKTKFKKKYRSEKGKVIQMDID